MGLSWSFDSLDSERAGDSIRVVRLLERHRLRPFMRHMAE
jgi:hypothetical protein